MKYRIWIGTFLPLIIGLIMSFLLQQSDYANAVFRGQYTFDIVGLLSRLGILITLMLIVALIVYRAYQRKLSDVSANIILQQTESHQRFLQRLNHELKNPIMILKLGLVNLQTDPEIENDETIVRIGQQTQRLEKLIQDLQLLTELSVDKLDKSEVNIAEVIDDAIASSTSTTNQRTIAVDLQTVPWQVNTVMGDRDLLVMGMRNLIDNAVKFTSADGQIQIRVKDDGHQATIEVADNGIGIEDNETEHVFEELYRGQNATLVNGSGLGLSLVERIIKLHGGTVNLRSRQNEGTLITISLNHQ